MRLLRERTNPITIDCVYLAIRKTHARSELEKRAGRTLSDHDLDSQRMSGKELAVALGKAKWCRDVAAHYNNQQHLERARELVSVLEAERRRRDLLGGQAGLA
jgi:hypothetical protein